jgi:hypothetical protein
MVPGMADERVDPSGNTDQFRAFVQDTPAEPARSRMPLLIGTGVALLVVAAVVAFLMTR